MRVGADEAVVALEACAGVHSEVRKSVELNKARCLLVAPNVEAGQGSEGPAESLEALLALAAEQQTPVVFALTRKKLAQACGARGGVSVVAVLDASGADDVLKGVLALAKALIVQ